MIAIAVALGVFVVVFTWFALIRLVREKGMRSLASNLAFEYMDRSLPTSFPAGTEPFDKISVSWNVIQGQKNGTAIVVFDSIVGNGRGVYRTFIAVQTTSDPFPRDEELLGNVLHSADWAALYGRQVAFNLVPWSLSTRRIAQYLNGLTL